LNISLLKAIEETDWHRKR